MEANDFIKYCHTLLQIISIPMDISTLHSEQNIMILHNLQLEGFMDLSVRENGIMFSFGAGDKNVYLIKNTDKHLFDPPVYYNDGNPFLDSSSKLLLIRLAVWISKKSKSIFSMKLSWEKRTLSRRLNSVMLESNQIGFSRSNS